LPLNIKHTDNYYLSFETEMDTASNINRSSNQEEGTREKQNFFTTMQERSQLTHILFVVLGCLKTSATQNM
jgi:hypothetical protein